MKGEFQYEKEGRLHQLFQKFLHNENVELIYTLGDDIHPEPDVLMRLEAKRSRYNCLLIQKLRYILIQTRNNF